MGSEMCIRDRGKRILSEGWREIDHIFRAFLKEKPADGDGDTLPDFTEGQTFDGAEVAVTEHFTQPPKTYTDVIHFESRQWKYSKCKGAG